MLRLICVLLLISIAFGQSMRPTVKFGMTLARCGQQAGISLRQQESLTWWAAYTNSQGGVNISGIIHDIEFIFYNDAFDPELMRILYERLILVDKVDVLLGPLGDGGPAYQVASSYNRTIMNSGDFNYYTSRQAPNGTFDGWLFSSVPNGATIPDQCYMLLKEKDATRAATAWSSDIAGSGFNIISALSVSRLELEIIPPFGSIDEDFDNIDKEIDKLPTNVDFFTGSMISVESSFQMVHRMLEKGYQPPAFVVWLGPGFESFRRNAPWMSAGMLFPDVWEPSLNYHDATFGDSQNFYDEFKLAMNRTPDATDVIAVFAATNMKLALEAAGSTDQFALRDALLSLNTENFFGLANFTGYLLQQTLSSYYCFQVAPDGVSVYPVSRNAANAREITYPVTINYPDDFKIKSKSSTGKWLGLGLGLGLGLLLLAAIGAAYLLLIKYQVIFIPKTSTEKGEW